MEKRRYCARHVRPSVCPCPRFRRRENALSVTHCSDTSAGECGFTAEPGHEDRYKESLDITLQYARTIGAKKIHLLSGRDLSSQGVTKAEQEKTLIKNLQESLPALQQANVIALIEPINSFSKPGYFLNNFETVGSPLVKMQLDLFHLQMTEGNLVNNIKKFLPFTGKFLKNIQYCHVQVAQAPHRHEPSMAGEVNYKYVLEQLYIAGYRGHIGCEYKPSVTSESSLGWIKEWGLHF
ncbi:hypothetical protein HAZT_HAZT003279 [Hyalella azteca]|uniref:Putative hydroxypyruvate isomerase n=1 Tax=Hyalella azteca TaxID=294128 RepID=A0A6A0GVD2_HYAAZ|nr:hypothetical protein HAZT_HAZT003279 [Hyalella azteca]